MTNSLKSTNCFSAAALPDGSAADSVTRPVSIPKAETTLSYDLDGNLTSDGTWQYAYDAENRLLSAVSADTITIGPNFPGQEPYDVRVRVEFTHDHTGAVVERRKYHDRADGSGSELIQTNRMFRDMAAIPGMPGPVVLETVGGCFGGACLPPINRAYLWGADLDGTHQGAGGVGGLLAVTDISNPDAPSTELPVYDGNGNVIAYAAASNGALSAEYSYGPFGEITVESGYLSCARFTFATKPLDLDLDLHDFGLRPYSPSLGRFINHDPISEQGGLNLYAYCSNDAVNGWDWLGLKIFVVKRPLTAFTSWWSEHLDTIGGAIGGLAPRGMGIIPGVYIGKVGKYYAGKTWHCSLIVSCSSGKNKSSSINAKGGLKNMKDVDPYDTWDFQSGGTINNPAADWQSVIKNNPFPGNYYAGRKSIETIINDDSKDADLLKILNAEPRQQNYVLGGSKRYNCCDWVTKVLKGIGQSYDSNNPSPFGNAKVPWWGNSSAGSIVPKIARPAA